VEELFKHPADAALFYFAGHGTVSNLGGFLVTPDTERYDDGFSMEWLLTLVNNSENIKEVIVILDCCHGGFLGQIPAIKNEHAILRQGVSVLTAGRASQVIYGGSQGGLFTGLVHAALQGGAADVKGDVTVASIYAYVDQILGAWDQRPMFKSHVSRLIPVRRCRPVVPLDLLRKLTEYFPSADYEFPLNPSFEPTEQPRNATNEKTFEHLQKYRAARLLEPVGEDHMYYAAMRRKPCRLTPLGEFYWDLAKKGKL